MSEVAAVWLDDPVWLYCTVHRMLEPYGREAIFLLEEGCSPRQVDRALKSVGLAMGFFEMW